MRKVLALFLALILLMLAATGCLPRIMQEFVGRYKEEERPRASMEPEAIQEPSRGETPLPAKTERPFIPKQSPQGIAEIYSKQDYVRLYSEYPQEIDLDGDGTAEKLTILENSGAPGSEMIGITVEKGGQTYAVEVERAYLKDAFIGYNAEEKPCIVLSYDYASADYTTRVYTFDGQSVAHTESVYGFVDGVYEGVWILSSAVYTLGTWSGYHKYTLSASFKFEPESPDVWMIQDAGSDRVLTAKAALNAQFIESGTLVPGVIQAGERLLPYAIEIDNVVYFRMEDGRTGILPVKFEEGYTYIDGQQDDTVFDNVMYSG